MSEHGSVSGSGSSRPMHANAPARVGPLRVLDLFSGTGGWSEAFRRRGHRITRIDNDSRFANVPDTYIMDVREAGFTTDYDVILASPPCTGFSVASLGYSWRVTQACHCGGVIERVGRHRGGTATDVCSNCARPRRVGAPTFEPLTEMARLCMTLVDVTFEIVGVVQPRWWWMENPRAMLRKILEARGSELPRTTITFCQYGERRMKPTDLWGHWPKTWRPQPACAQGASCHDAAPRGSRTGTQALTSAVAKAAIPFDLSLEVCTAVETA